MNDKDRVPVLGDEELSLEDELLDSLETDEELTLDDEPPKAVEEDDELTLEDDINIPEILEPFTSVIGSPPVQVSTGEIIELDPLVGDMALTIDEPNDEPQTLDLRGRIREESIESIEGVSDIFDDTDETTLTITDDEDFYGDLQADEQEEEFRIAGVRPARLVSELSPAESSNSLVSLFSTKIAELKRTLTSTSSTASEDSKELGRIVSRTSLSFLKPAQVSSLMLHIYTARDKTAILQGFTKEHNLSAVNRMKLAQAIDQILFDYHSYKQHQQVRKGITESGVVDIGPIMQTCQQDLEEIDQAVSEGNLCFVRHIVEEPDGTTFVCGNCGEVSHSDRDFVTLVVHQNLDDQDAYLKVFPKGCTCDHCGKMNVISDAEHVRLSGKLNDEYKRSLRSWFSASTPKTSQSVNAIRYRPEVSRYPTIYPALFEERVSTEMVDVQDKAKDFFKLNSWYEEFKDLLKSMDKVSNVTNGGTVVSKDGVTTVKHDDLFKELRPLVKLYCKMFNEDFYRLYTNAVNTLLLYIQDNPTLHVSLGPELLYDYEMSSIYRNYLNEDLGDDTEDVYVSILRQIGEGSDDSSYFATHGQEAAKQRIEELIVKRESMIDTVIRSQREKAIQSLDTTYPLIRVLAINSVAAPNSESLKYLLSDERVVQWIDRSALMMMVGRLAPKAFELWNGKSIPEYKNKSLFNKASTKPLVERLTTAAKKYMTYFNSLGKKPPGSLVVMAYDFLSVHTFNREMVSATYELRDAFVNRDLFKFYSGIEILRHHSLSVSHSLSPLAELVKKYSDQASEFFSSRKPSSPKDYFTFHYGDQFSEQEIDKYLESNPSPLLAKKAYILKRIESENFTEYLTRLADSTLENSEAKYVDPHSMFFLENYGYIPSILFASEYLRVSVQLGEAGKPAIFMGDLIYHSTVPGSYYMHKLLGVPTPSRDMYEFSPVLKATDPVKSRLDYILSDIVFPSRSVNLIRGFDENQNIFTLMLEEPDLVEPCLSLMGDFGGLVNEYYFS